MDQHTGDRSTICLNMIVRDEAHIVHEVIEAVAPFIDSWVIVDTGSTDGTQDLIRRLMAERSIPGTLYERPWRDFGHNRSEALALAQGHADYIWVMDADDTVTGTIDFSTLTADAYSMRIRDGVTYWRLQLFRNGALWRYAGVLHEVAVCDTPCHQEQLEGDYSIVSRRLGARSRDPQKYARDAELMQAEVDRDPDDRRSVFYLAQSYFWAGDMAKARQWFVRRAEMGGWEEEVFFSMFRAAEVMDGLGEPWPVVQDAYLRAWSQRPTRAEPLYAIAHHYRIAGQYRLGHLFAERAAQIPLPLSDVLFVNASVYEWRALDEQAVCGSWIGKSAESFAICRRLLARADLPDDDRQRIVANRDLAVPQMLESASATPRDLPARLAGGGSADVTVSLVAGPDRAATEYALNSFLNSCLDRDRVGRYLVFDAGLSAADRFALLEQYPFLEFGPRPSGLTTGAELSEIRRHGSGHYWLKLGQGWRFFAPERLLTRLISVFDAEPEILQVGVNFEDADALTGRCTAESDVRRTADGGRYALSSALVTGPAMVHVARFFACSGSDTGTEHSPLSATLDEVLCLSAH
jgi:hypothetical protein